MLGVQRRMCYRTHRLSELETEREDLFRAGRDVTSLASKDMATVLDQLFYFSGGGTTDLAATSK
jgi:hypothetical protein